MVDKWGIVTGMNALVSRMGAYVKLGESFHDDVFYYCTDSADLYLEVKPADRTARIVHADSREGWKALGVVGDHIYDHVLTTETLIKHMKIAATAMLRG